MAFTEIQMWADMINSQEAERINYDLACRKSIKDSSILESKHFTSTKQRQLDPRAYGFSNRELTESIYQKNSIEGKIAFPSESINGEFAIEVASLFPSVEMAKMKSCPKGLVVEGKYDDLLDIWSLNESGHCFNDVANAMIKESLKQRFDEAFFSEGYEEDVNPLDDKIDPEEYGFGDSPEEDVDGFGMISLEFQLSDDDEHSCEKFYEKITQDDGLYDVSMSKCNVSGPYEKCSFSGSIDDLKEVFAIWNGFSSWSQYKAEVGADAEQEFSNCCQQQLHEADCREPISHGLDCIGVKASTANLSEYNGVETSLCESKRKKRLHEGVMGALGGAALGGLVGAVGGGMVGKADTTIGTIDGEDIQTKVSGTADAKAAKQFFAGDAQNINPDDFNIKGDTTPNAEPDSGFGIRPMITQKQIAAAIPNAPRRVTIDAINGMGDARLEAGWHSDTPVGHITADGEMQHGRLSGKGTYGDGKFTGVAFNKSNAGIGAGVGAVAGGAFGAYATSDDDDDKKNEAEEFDYNPDDDANDYNDAHSDEYDEMMDASGKQTNDVNLTSEKNEAEEFFNINEDESPKSLEAKPFRVNWIDSKGKVHTSNVAATDASSAKSMISQKHDGCDVKGVEDLSNVYKQWKQEAMYESMMVEATLADALGSSDLDKLNTLEAKLSDDGMTADERMSQQHKDDIEAEAVANMELPYEGMDKAQIDQELIRRHHFVGNEIQLFWKVMNVLGYKPEDVASMRDEEVVNAITMHIPKGRKPRFYGYIDPMIKNKGFVDDGGGQLDDNGHPNGKTGDWNSFYKSVTPVEYSPAELDMMHNDEDIDDRRQRRSQVVKLSRQIDADNEKKALDNAMPVKGQDTWMTVEVTKLMKSMPRPKARKILASIIDDIKTEYGISDKYITDKTSVADDVKEKCAQEILFLKSLFGKDIGMGPTLRDYPIAWGKDAGGEYVSHTTAGQYNDETELMVRRAMATVMNVPYIPANEQQDTMRRIIDNDQLCKVFIQELMQHKSKRSYGSKSLGKTPKVEVQ